MIVRTERADVVLLLVAVRRMVAVRPTCCAGWCRRRRTRRATARRGRENHRSRWGPPAGLGGRTQPRVASQPAGIGCFLGQGRTVRRTGRVAHPGAAAIPPPCRGQRHWGPAVAGRRPRRGDHRPRGTRGPSAPGPGRPAGWLGGQAERQAAEAGHQFGRRLHTAPREEDLAALDALDRGWPASRQRWTTGTHPRTAPAKGRQNVPSPDLATSTTPAAWSAAGGGNADRPPSACPACKALDACETSTVSRISPRAERERPTLCAFTIWHWCSPPSPWERPGCPRCGTWRGRSPAPPRAPQRT